MIEKQNKDKIVNNSGASGDKSGLGTIGELEEALNREKVRIQSEEKITGRFNQ